MPDGLASASPKPPGTTVTNAGRAGEAHRLAERHRRLVDSHRPIVRRTLDTLQACSITPDDVAL